MYKLLRGLKQTLIFSDGIVSPMSRCVQKNWVKIPREPQRSQWKIPEPVCYNLWFWSLRREVEFFSKGNQIFSRQNNHWVIGSSSKWCHIVIGRLIVFWEFIPKKAKRLVFLWILIKIQPILLCGSKWTLVFSNSIVSPVGRLVQNTESKFQGNPIEAHEKGQNQCVVTFVFRVWGEKLGFSLKAT